MNKNEKSHYQNVMGYLYIVNSENLEQNNQPPLSFALIVVLKYLCIIRVLKKNTMYYLPKIVQSHHDNHVNHDIT